jgi:hypothetical protein
MSRGARILSEFVLGALAEMSADRQRARPRLSQSSVDDQIDAILLKYESDCIVSVEPMAMGEAYLLEAGEDDEEDKDAPANATPKVPELGDPAEIAADKEVEAKTADKDDEQPDVEADPLVPKIDLKMFAGKVSRLATNYDALLEMPKSIANRARNYLEQNYGKAIADEFAEIMERDFDIELEHEDPSEPRERPFAVGAAASGLGGGG